MSTDAPQRNALAFDTPADAAFRRIARLCEERAAASDASGGSDRRLVWSYGQQTAVQLAQWARRLPPALEGKINASHLCAGLTMLCGEREGDPQDRRVHRVVLTLFLSLLQEASIAAADDLYAAAALWAFLQRMALISAISIGEGRGRGASTQVQEARSAVMRVRENLIMDLSEIVIGAAAMVLTRQQPATDPAPTEPSL